MMPACLAKINVSLHLRVVGGTTVAGGESDWRRENNCGKQRTSWRDE